MRRLGIQLAASGLIFQTLTGAADDGVQFSALNKTLGGSLIGAYPFAKPCFTSYNGDAVAADQELCNAVRANYTSNAFRDGTYGALMNTQGESCLSEPANQCLLDNTVSPAALPQQSSGADSNATTTCSQGSVPPAYVDVRGADDVVGAFTAAHAAGLPLSIRNSGHDYLTRSSHRGSLGLWLHGLKGLAHHEAFVPAGCGNGSSSAAVSRGVRALTVAAGETTGDAIAFAAAHGSTLVTGYSQTIALSGGWVQGGGHSVLAPAFGMGADRVVEFEVVTPEPNGDGGFGVLRRASACENPELFRALRGGGGGTFGVVLAATHKVEVAAPVAVASLTIPSNSSEDTVLQWIELQARESLRWGQEGWGGHVAGLYLKHFNPLPPFANDNLTNVSAAAESMRSVTEFVLSVGGTSDIEVMPTWLDAWNKYIAPGATNSAGGTRIITSRLIPQDLFVNDTGIAQIVDYIRAAAQLGFDPKNLYVPVGTPYVANATKAAQVADHGTSVHPAWYGALWSLAGGNSIPWNATYAQRLAELTAITNVTRLQEALAGPSGGSYTNEANPFTQDWQNSWWGSNYDFLKATKAKYDPERLLSCWKCVGFEEHSSVYEYGCMEPLQADIDKAFS
ncbi:hypothetical protein BX600DRAFT_375104 [Xylariales sp. PMI_506]|nr:hypothetical protein BX600DRAFT_375104 [Xylariales sp. PMI_506]